jgi:hypothetical protein
MSMQREFQHTPSLKKHELIFPEGLRWSLRMRTEWLLLHLELAYGNGVEGWLA